MLIGLGLVGCGPSDDQGHSPEPSAFVESVVEGLGVEALELDRQLRALEEYDAELQLRKDDFRRWFMVRHGIDPGNWPKWVYVDYDELDGIASIKSRRQSGPSTELRGGGAAIQLMIFKSDGALPRLHLYASDTETFLKRASSLTLAIGDARHELELDSDGFASGWDAVSWLISLVEAERTSDRVTIRVRFPRGRDRDIKNPSLPQVIQSGKLLLALLELESSPDWEFGR